MGWQEGLEGQVMSVLGSNHKWAMGVMNKMSRQMGWGIATQGGRHGYNGEGKGMGAGVGWGHKVCGVVSCPKSIL